MGQVWVHLQVGTVVEPLQLQLLLLLLRSHCLQVGRCDMINTVADTTSTTTPGRPPGRDRNLFPRVGRCGETREVASITSITTLGKPPGRDQTQIGFSRWLHGRARERG